MEVLVEMRDGSERPTGEERKQVFSMGADIWIDARYRAGDWIDDGGHVVVNVVYWCDLPHPANFSNMRARILYEPEES